MLQLSIGSLCLCVSLGLVAGVLSGALGVGSGILLVPALVLLCHTSQPTAQGAALAVMVPMALIGAIRYGTAGAINMDVRLLGLIALGAVLGSLAGSELAVRLPADIVRKGFAVFMIVVAVKMFCATASKSRVTPTQTAGIERMNTHD